MLSDKRQASHIPDPRRQRHPGHGAQSHRDAPVFEEDLGAHCEVVEEAAAVAGELVPEADEIFIAREIVAAAAHHLAGDVEQVIDGEDGERVGDPGPRERDDGAEAPFEHAVGHTPDPGDQEGMQPRGRREGEGGAERRAARDIFRRPLAAQHRDHQAIAEGPIGAAAAPAALRAAALVPAVPPAAG